jgi:uncharacterized protein with HEPN domain
MDARAKKLLFDVLESGRSIQGWCRGSSYSHYLEDRQLRRAVEREFEIIGEALNRLAQADADTAVRVESLSRIVAFRNRIIHGYDDIDDALVWGVIQSHLPELVEQVGVLLREGGELV